MEEWRKHTILSKGPCLVAQQVRDSPQFFRKRARPHDSVRNFAVVHDLRGVHRLAHIQVDTQTDRDNGGEEDEEEGLEEAVLSEGGPLNSSPRLTKSPLPSPSVGLEGSLSSSSPLIRRRSSAYAASRGRRRSSGKAPIHRDQLPKASGTQSLTSATLLPLPLRLIRTAAEQAHNY